MTEPERFFQACETGDAETLRALLASDPSLARIASARAPYAGWTALHEAAKRGHLQAVRILLDHGADPNAREAGDNTYPLHWAAANRSLEIVRALLDAGGDVHGIGDLHELDAIGWAAYFHPSGGARGEKPEVAAFLVERGARHHIFSAMSIGDMALIRRVAEDNPDALNRRMSRFEDGLTALHFAIVHERLDILDLLIELGANIEAQDGIGRTPLETAMSCGNREAMRRLHRAGAKLPEVPPAPQADLASLAEAGRKTVPMLAVPDVAQALEWYGSIGFKETGRYEDGGVVNWAMMSFGEAELMFNLSTKPGQVDLWIYVDERIEQIYRTLRVRQFAWARDALAGGESRLGIAFVQHLYEPPYGGQEFALRDLNGYRLTFLGPPKK